MSKKSSKKNQLNERVIFECKPHWFRLFWPAVIGIFFILSGFSSFFTGDISNGFMILIVGILVFVIPYLAEKTNKLVLTDKRLYGKTGIIRIKTLSAPIEKIQTVNINTGLLGRILGYSDLVIHCITGIYTFKKQSNAEEMQNAILNAIK